MSGRNPIPRTARPSSRGTGGYDFAARPSRTGLDQPIHWTPDTDPAVIVLAQPPDWLAPPGSSSGLEPTDGIDTLEGCYVRWGGGPSGMPLVFPRDSHPDGPLAALVLLDGDGLDRAEAVMRLCRRLLGRSAPDGRLTPFRRRRIPMELRAADARSEGASYRDIAEALHGRERVAEEDGWRSSSLRNEAIDLVSGGKALIAGGYRKLFHHRRRP